MLLHLITEHDTCGCRVRAAQITKHYTLRGQVQGHWNRIILEWNLEKQGGKMWNRFIWLRIGSNRELFIFPRKTLLHGVGSLKQWIPDIYIN
jgi:hypothetical protein